MTAFPALVGELLSTGGSGDESGCRDRQATLLPARAIHSPAPGSPAPRLTPHPPWLTPDPGSPQTPAHPPPIPAHSLPECCAFNHHQNDLKWQTASKSRYLQTLSLFDRFCLGKEKETRAWSGAEGWPNWSGCVRRARALQGKQVVKGRAETQKPGSGGRLVCVCVCVCVWVCVWCVY